MEPASKRKAAMGLLAVLVVALGTSPAKALITPTMTFSMPQGVDPVSLYFAFDGQSFTLPGQALLAANFGGAGGVDVHSIDGNHIRFSKLVIKSNFGHTVNIVRKTADPAFPKWSGPSSIFFPGNQLVLKTQPGSARIGQHINSNVIGNGEAFGLLIVNKIDPSLISAFHAANFQIKAKVNHAPEPGVLALLGAGGIGALTLFRFRKRRAS